MDYRNITKQLIARTRLLSTVIDELVEENYNQRCVAYWLTSNQSGAERAKADMWAEIRERQEEPAA